jgi:hypothetical protein
MKTSNNRKLTEATAPINSGAALAQLESELRATDLLALNATIKSAQEGVSGEELFSVLQQIRKQTRNSLERLQNLVSQDAHS